ncbi:MAG: Flp pilus assembly protein CpaB [Actinobacteria bacterium]|nr:Flp pilus assembly protein CpaB [Actinomycetota bacterium]
MKRRVSGLVIALVLASAGTFVLANYVESAKDRAVAGEKLVDALVVSVPVAAGTAAADLEASVKTVQVPAKVRADGAADSLKDLEGLEAGVDLVPGEQVITSRFVRPGSRTTGVPGVPEDKLLVTVSLDPERAVGGQLKPGDTVGVLASFDSSEQTSSSTNLILHKVPVVAVQGAAGEVKSTNVKIAASTDDGEEGAAPAPTAKLLITLALDAPSVERVVFAAEHGFLWLSAEPADAPEGGTKVVTKGNVYGKDVPA